MNSAQIEGTDYVQLTADLVGAYVSNNPLPAADLPALLSSVYQAVTGLGTGVAATQAAAEVEKPSSAQIRKSITHDGLVSFIDGKSYKTLKRHLGVHDLTPETYKAKYGLPSDYPMVAPSYAAQRSQLAKDIGLGRPGGMTRAAASNDAAPPAKAPRKKAA